MFFLIEKMKGLVPQQRDLRILSEQIVDRSGAGFLHAGNDEVDLLNMTAPKGNRFHV